MRSRTYRLTALGLAAAAIFADGRIHAQSQPAVANFDRMFRLPPFAPPTPEITAALMALGKRGGLMDAQDDVAAGPLALIVDPALSRHNRDNDEHTAGVTFLGQFLDHDMAFDTASRLGQPTNPRTASNARQPYFDLDSVYGDGPTGSPLLYEPDDRARFRLESNGRFEDLPRDLSGRAIISDPRNDENIVIAGLQIAFLRFHNRIVDLSRAARPGLAADDVFREARRQATWHYQWLILHEVLPLFVGSAMVHDLTSAGPRFYAPPPGQVRADSSGGRRSFAFQDSKRMRVQTSASIRSCRRRCSICRLASFRPARRRRRWRSATCCGT